MKSEGIHRFHPSPEQGLTHEQVQQRIRQGLQNQTPPTISKSVGQIFKDNICTLFNLFNFIIALSLALVGAWSNMVFICIILVNICIGIGQELHAKRLVDKLSVLSRPTVHVLRDGQEQEISIEELVLEDVMILTSGTQICADATLLSGQVEVNEALLTGESDPINKTIGDEVLSGSFVVSGKCVAVVEHIGEDNYATKLSAEAKKLKKLHSELMTSMQKVTRFTGFFIIPLGLVLFVQALVVRNAELSQAVISTSAGLLGMLPKGLVLLISVSLAVGVIRLAKKQILVQALFSLETLAHVDVLCLDKTGTLTEGNMQVESVQSLCADPPVSIDQMFGSFLFHSDDNNATFKALDDFFQARDEYHPTGKIAFSSQRKWSSMTFGTHGTLVLGAPERLMPHGLPDHLQRDVENGFRVLVLAWTESSVQADQPLPPLFPLQAIVLSDVIRKGAKETLAYFQREGVDVKVISGDHPAAVCAIARRAGLANASQFIDMTGIEDPTEIAQAAKTYTVFGRVSPGQKKLIVQALQSQGHSVAMTGDGVNDILALREADCSIAIAAGSDAAKQISQLVLLHSDFTALPNVLLEGRRVVNNITRVAGIFFVKTLYSFLLSLICVLGNLPFPFAPIQITLIDFIIEAYPSFCLSFEPDGTKLHGTFLGSVLKKALPNALAVVITVMIAYLWTPSLGFNAEQTTLLMYLMVGTISCMAVCKACYPFNALRIFLTSTVTLGYFGAVILFHHALDLTSLSSLLYQPWLVLTLLAVVIERLLSKVFSKRTPLRL